MPASQHGNYGEPNDATDAFPFLGTRASATKSSSDNLLDIRVLCQSSKYILQRKRLSGYKINEIPPSIYLVLTTAIQAEEGTSLNLDFLERAIRSLLVLFQNLRPPLFEQL